MPPTDTTIPESHRDLLEAKFATLATINPDGRPQATVLWFLAEGDEVALSLNTDRQKTRNLRERPACSLVIVDLENPFRYLELRGDAELEDDPDYAFADRVGQKYGADLRAFDGPGGTRVKVTLRLTRVDAVDLSG